MGYGGVDMIDMLYISYRITRSEYNEMFRIIQERFKGTSHQLRKDKFDKCARVTNGLSKQGFQEIRLRSNMWGYRALEIRLRPKLLIQIGDYYRLTAISEFTSVALSFNHILKDVLGLYVPDFFQWKVERVEYAADVPVGEELIPKYLFLFKKGNIPDYFLANNTTQKYWDSEINCYLMATSITANWYNRYETLLLKEQNSKKKYTDFSHTRGILRFETQSRVCEGTVTDYLDSNRTEKEIMKFYKLIVGNGDYYTLDTAIQLIRSKVEHFQKRLALEKLITLIAESSGVWHAKEIFLKGKDKRSAADEFSKRLNQLRKIGINPVVLPSEWGISKLENLFDRIKENIEV